MTLVFDTSALVAQAGRERGADIVDGLLANASNARLIHAVNLCELHNTTVRRSSSGNADFLIAHLRRLGVATRDDLDEPFWRAVAWLKGAIPAASLGDCFALALAQRVGGAVVTADRPGSLPARELAVCEVVLIR